MYFQSKVWRRRNRREGAPFVEQLRAAQAVARPDNLIEQGRIRY
jgi:hypothetical protein